MAFMEALGALSAVGGGGSGAASLADHTNQSSGVTVGAFNVPAYVGKPDFDVSDPQTAVMVGAAVLIGGALLLKVVR